MVCLFLTLILACATYLQACPEPISIHYEHYEGPIILHTANCNNPQQRCHDNQQHQCPDNQQQHCNDNQQYGYYGNQYKPGCCETQCTCVSKHSYAPYGYGYGSPTNVGCCCPVADTPLVYCVCNTCGGNGYPSNCVENQGYQGYQNCQGKYSGCKKQ